MWRPGGCERGGGVGGCPGLFEVRLSATRSRSGGSCPCPSVQESSLRGRRWQSHQQMHSCAHFRPAVANRGDVYDAAHARPSWAYLVDVRLLVENSGLQGALSGKQKDLRSAGATNLRHLESSSGKGRWERLGEGFPDMPPLTFTAQLPVECLGRLASSHLFPSHGFRVRW